MYHYHVIVGTNNIFSAMSNFKTLIQNGEDDLLCKSLKGYQDLISAYCLISALDFKSRV